jgi:LysM repeat protein
MKTFRQHFQHLQERAHPTSQATPVLPGDELAFDPDEYLQTRYGDPDSRFDNLTSTELPQVDIPQFDRLTKSAEFDFRKGIVEPEADTDTKLMVDPNPYTQSWGGKFSVDQPNGEPAPGRTRWEYVPNTDAKDNTRWVPSSEADSIASWKANNPGKSDLDWGTPPAAAPALDTTKPNAKYKFNRNTQQQELDTAPDNQSITWRDIYRLNKKTIGSDPGRIKPGQVLKMPNGAPDYTVQTGDTLSKIAGQNSSDAAPVKRPERPITPTPDNKDSQPRRVRTPTPGNIQPLVTPLTGLYVPPNQNFTGQTGKDKEEIVTPELLRPKNEQPSSWLTTIKN